MGIRNLRGLGGTQGCQAVIDGEVCHREYNATVHRPNRQGYHEYQETATEEPDEG